MVLSGLLPPQWLEWHPCAPVLLAGTDDGNVWMWKIPSGECKTFQSAACQATAGKILPDGDGGGGVMTNAKTKLHQNVRNTISSSPGKRAVVGYEDGTVRVWDLKQGNAIHVIKGDFFLYFYCPDVIVTQKVFRKTFVHLLYES